MKNIFYFIRSVLIVVPNTFFWALASCLVTFTPWSKAGIRFCGRWWGWINLKGNGVRVEYRGLENVNPHQTYMVVSNHKSFLDIYAVFSCPALYCLFVAKRELTKIPVFGLALQRSGSIIIDRSNRKQAVAELKKQGRVLRENEISIVIFAEGTRTSPAIRLGKFKKGGFMLATQLGLPILPLSIKGSGQLQPKGRIAVKPGHLILTFSPAIATPDYEDGIDLTTLMDQTYQAIDQHL
ncbi:MAG: 1-acyl-sn-glycerol-3-phosphate acyltransferase [Deltaproteobacteria bacterium]|nr:1-acyl-sn-glycerol-3-phosphate acyltransferase [Deltaproteobacteria bacterium]